MRNSIKSNYRDNAKYWVERHNELKDDIRSVGNLGKSVEENEKGYIVKNERLQSVFQILGINLNGLNVLEVGCGIGLMAPSVVTAGGIYTGIDISERALETARSSCVEGTFVCGNIVLFDLGFTFDLIFCTDVLVHIVNDDNWRSVWRCIESHLSEKGQVVIKEGLGETRSTYSSHVVSRSMDEYKGCLLEIGLDIKAVEAVPDFYSIRRL